MLVATMIEKLQRLPAHMEVLVDFSRAGDPGFLLRSPEIVDEAEMPNGDKFVFIGSGTENPFEGLN